MPSVWLEYETRRIKCDFCVWPWIQHRTNTQFWLLRILFLNLATIVLPGLQFWSLEQSLEQKQHLWHVAITWFLLFGKCLCPLMCQLEDMWYQRHLKCHCGALMAHVLCRSGCLAKVGCDSDHVPHELSVFYFNLEVCALYRNAIVYTKLSFSFSSAVHWNLNAEMVCAQYVCPCMGQHNLGKIKLPSFHTSTESVIFSGTGPYITAHEPHDFKRL